MLPLRPILVMLLTICCSMGVGSLCRAADANDAADIRTPLLQEGKRTLYQRVISHPGARLADAPAGAGAEPLRGFTPLYVYGRQNVQGADWLEVSPSVKATRTRWIRSDACSPWDKALTLLFADRMSRDPVLFFRNFDALNALVRATDMRAALDGLLRAPTSPQSPLLAVEPREASVPRKQFYLMPIFDYSDEYEQHNLRLLKIGVVDPGVLPTAAPRPAPAPVTALSPVPAPAPVPAPQAAAPEPHFSAGIAFIVDTTISMGPYIEQTKNFIHSTYNALEKSSIAEDVALAVVAYRNSTKHNAKLEYVSSVVAPFTRAGSRAQAEPRVQGMDEAAVSTHAFNEDAFAGIKAAIDGLDWSPYAVKLAVMVTDAGAIRNDDPLSSTGLTEKEMGDLLAQKGIRLVVVHLHTKAGQRHNLAGTVQQYRQLTAVRDGNVKSAYVALPVSDPQTASRQFSRIAAKLVDVLQQLVVKAAQGAPIAKPSSPPPAALPAAAAASPAAVPAAAVAPAAPQAVAAAPDPEALAAYIGQALGYAAYLEFAGERQKATAPRLMEAWVADKDLGSLVEGKSTDALMAAVLLNKNQLNTLARQIGLLIDAARASRMTDSRDLFQRVISLSSQTLRDPERLQRAADDNLCAQGLLPEFLTGLPYKSQVMNLTEERWLAMSAREQDELIYSLEAKLRLYAEYHNDADNWVTFGSADPAEALYRVPLTSLP